MFPVLKLVYTICLLVYTINFLCIFICILSFCYFLLSLCTHSVYLSVFMHFLYSFCSFFVSLCTFQLVFHYVFIMFSSLYREKEPKTSKNFLKKISKKCWHTMRLMLFYIQQNKQQHKITDWVLILKTPAKKKKLKKLLTNSKSCVILSTTKAMKGR